ncbi:hypothetical protein DOTSEDRAFT_142040 [Dothistroma septosporum NZE10]|uniref:Homeobox domain-containing protein n=1 Tax=Dothistroma septosporum (strain NZE10 / CBS 128990) TaxID=675120 RepID=N1Q0E2_DOTSN|nr:hypothetical protein DOTSEDRAFT_142040 [Dothistroma septosporum NZE10]
MGTQVERSNSSSPGLYSFLNHSADTVHNNLPPNVDDRPSARQKRRRTSPEDQGVLEAAYKRDPKPDKAARLELVKGVQLGEKEVQASEAIWFQNRRQSSRRKSRPLLPHEVAHFQMSRAAGSTTGLAYTSDREQHDVESSSQDRSQPSPRTTRDNRATGHAVRPLTPTAEMDSRVDASTSSTQQQNQLRHTNQRTDNSHAESLSLSGAAMSTSHSAEEAPPPAYVVNEPGVSSLHQMPSEHTSSPASLHPTPARRLKKSASVIRLSLNAEGKAEIVTKDASSPSPPRPAQTAATDLSASVSSTTPIPPPKTLQRSFSGRSRDSRSWEFWCDKESRNSLETAAEKDAAGSAAGAIELLRSASGRNFLGSNPSKRNFLLPLQQPGPAKRSKLDHKRTSLQRSSTSMGRLQESRSSRSLGYHPKLKHLAKSAYVKSTDSDKENWSPTSDEAAEEHRGHHRQERQGVDGDPENDEELASFMRGGRQPAGDDDLDCVQGLLSLSQGNWR